MKIISIIGLGNVGETIVSSLIEGYNNAWINVIDTNPEVQGAFLDLAHASVAKNNIRICFERKDLLEESDYIIFCAGVQNKPNEERGTVMCDNLKVAKACFKSFRLNPKSIIIMVTNPVDALCFYLKKILATNNTIISAGTLIDTLRYRYILSDKLSVMHDAIESLVIGEHGNSMVPVNSHTYVHDEKVEDLLSKQELNEIRHKLINSATYIRQTAQATKFAIAQSVMIILHSLEKSSTSILPIGVPINNYYKDLLSIEEDIFISLPCEVSNYEIEPINAFQLMPDEVAKLKHSANQIINTIYANEHSCSTSKVLLS